MSSPAARPRPPAPRRQPLYLRRPLLAGFLRQWPLLVVIVSVGIGLLLPLPRVGFLAVRSRPVDVALTAGAGAVLAIIALTIPYS